MFVALYRFTIHLVLQISNLFTRDPKQRLIIAQQSVNMSMSPSTEPAAVTATEKSPQPALSNRGNKLTGQENPGSIRPKMKWNRSRQEIKAEDHDENMDFEVNHLKHGGPN